MRLHPLPISLILLASILVACGTGPDSAAASSSTIVSDITVPTTGLPPSADGDSSTTTSSTTSPPLPSASALTTTTTSPTLTPEDGPLTVAEALKRELDGPVTVTGFLVLSDDAIVLAEFLLESYPAQPGGSTLPVVGVDPAGLDTESAGGVTWTSHVVEIAGILESGVLYVESENL